MEKIHIWQQTKKWLDLSNTPFNKHHFSYWSIEIEKKKKWKEKEHEKKRQTIWSIWKHLPQQLWPLIMIYMSIIQVKKNYKKKTNKSTHSLFPIRKRRISLKPSTYYNHTSKHISPCQIMISFSLSRFKYHFLTIK